MKKSTICFLLLSLSFVVQAEGIEWKDQAYRCFPNGHWDVAVKRPDVYALYACGDADEEAPSFCMVYHKGKKTFYSHPINDYHNEQSYPTKTFKTDFAKVQVKKSDCESWGFPSIGFQVNSQASCRTTRYYTNTYIFSLAKAEVSFFQTYHDQYFSRWEGKDVITEEKFNDAKIMPCLKMK